MKDLPQRCGCSAHAAGARFVLTRPGALRDRAVITTRDDRFFERGSLDSMEGPRRYIRSRRPIRLAAQKRANSRQDKRSHEESSLSLSARVLIGLVLGVAAGILLGESAVSAPRDNAEE